MKGRSKNKWKWFLITNLKILKLDENKIKGVEI